MEKLSGLGWILFFWGLLTGSLCAYTPAGTVLFSPTTLQYTDPDGGLVFLQARDVIDRVDELIEIEARTLESAPISSGAGQTNQLVRFEVLNQGNGREAVTLTVDNALRGDQFDPALSAIYLDNGDELFDPATDRLYSGPSDAPVLGRMGSSTNRLMVFVLNNIPASAGDTEQGMTRLTATAVSGSGAIGTVIEGAGDENTAVVVGFSGGQDYDKATYLVEQATLTARKSVELSHPDHPVLTEALPGSVLRYTLRTDVTGGGTLNNVVMSDPIPSRTAYTPGSLSLNGISLSDAQDGDAGEFDAAENRIVVRLGPLSADSAEQVIIFETTMKKEDQ